MAYVAAEEKENLVAVQWFCYKGNMSPTLAFSVLHHLLASLAYQLGPAVRKWVSANELNPRLGLPPLNIDLRRYFGFTHVIEFP